MNEPPKLSRSNFLSGAAALAAGALIPARSRADSLPVGTVRQLWLYNNDTKEEVRAYLTVDGTHLWRGNAQYPGYDQICWLLRDWHTGAVAEYDLRVLEAAWEIQQVLYAYRNFEPLCITSAYRTEETNVAVGGVPRSYHNRLPPAALDFVVPGVSLEFLWRVAASREITGGLGFYPHCQHIHLDSGPRRYWTDNRPCH